MLALIELSAPHTGALEAQRGNGMRTHWWNSLSLAPRTGSRSFRSRVAPGVGMVVALLALAACGSPTVGPSPTATATMAAPTATRTVAPTATTGGPYHVLVYFSKKPDSLNDPSKVFPVDRYSPTLGVATYAINQLIAGPTAAESGAGYWSEIHGKLSGSSNCGGADFKITLDHKGATPATGYATLQFCRATSLPGDLSGSYIRSEITTTLKQFSNIKNVVILDAQGGCFDDLSGQNLCLK